MYLGQKVRKKKWFKKILTQFPSKLGFWGPSEGLILTPWPILWKYVHNGFWPTKPFFQVEAHTFALQISKPLHPHNKSKFWLFATCEKKIKGDPNVQRGQTHDETKIFHFFFFIFFGKTPPLSDWILIGGSRVRFRDFSVISQKSATNYYADPRRVAKWPITFWGPRGSFRTSFAILQKPAVTGFKSPRIPVKLKNLPAAGGFFFYPL